MLSNRIEVVFDVEILTLVAYARDMNALVLTGRQRDRFEAIFELISHCPNRLIVNDEDGVLAEVYIVELGPRYPLLQASLIDCIGNEKLVVAAERHALRSEVVLPNVRHLPLIRAALASKPRYFVSTIPDVIDDHALVQSVWDLENVRIVTPQQYVYGER